MLKSTRPAEPSSASAACRCNSRRMFSIRLTSSAESAPPVDRGTRLEERGGPTPPPGNVTGFRGGCCDGPFVVISGISGVSQAYINILLHIGIDLGCSWRSRSQPLGDITNLRFVKKVRWIGAPGFITFCYVIVLGNPGANLKKFQNCPLVVTLAHPSRWNTIPVHQQISRPGSGIPCFGGGSNSAHSQCSLPHLGSDQTDMRFGF